MYILSYVSTPSSILNIAYYRRVIFSPVKAGSQYDTRTCVTCVTCVASRHVVSRHVVLHYVTFHSACSQYRCDVTQYLTPPNSSTTPPTYYILQAHDLGYCQEKSNEKKANLPLLMKTQRVNENKSVWIC